MSSKNTIDKIILQQSRKGYHNPNFLPSSQTVLDFNILTTNKADDILRQMSLDVDEFSGTPKISIMSNRDDVGYPEDISLSDSPSEQNEQLENFVLKLLMQEELAIKVETERAGGIFKWLFKDELLLLITLYTVDPSRRSHKNLPESPYSIKFFRGDRNSAPSSHKSLARLVYGTLQTLRKTEKEEFDASYRRFLELAFRPFDEFLYNERLSIRDPKYRPQSKYIKREKSGEKDERAYLEIQDPPRQMTEGGNSVVPAAEGNQRYLSARVSDFDEFEQLLIFEEGYRLKNWPNEGTLILEGDMASNRRKWDAIRNLKNRGLTAHARLADVLIRPWGLPHVNPIPRSYFNPGISHDDEESQPQAHAIDIALTSPDVTLIHGPPGTGKTTVIVEIIRHVIANGGRVMMCAPTHVAVDNVLERVADIKGIAPVRVGGTWYMDEGLQQFRIQERSKSLSQALPNFSHSSGKDETLSQIQTDFKRDMEKRGRRHLENLAINQANLVCGTTIGIARYEPPIDNPIDFDVLIIDEASKATVMEFLVPAVRAKRWILVGDHRQLPPYVNEQEIRIYVQRYFEDMEKQPEEQKNGKGKRNSAIYDERTNQLIASLRRFHEEMHALKEGQPRSHWSRIVELFDNRRKPIISIEEMVNFALGSCFHYFLQRIDQSRNGRLLVQHRMPSILSNFLDEAIYKGQLKTSRSAMTHGLVLPAVPSIGLASIDQPMTFVSTETLSTDQETPGKYKGYFNAPEAETIAEIIAAFTQIDAESLGYSEAEPLTIGVITYYAGQSREINRHLRTVDEIEQDRGWRYRVPGKPIRIRVSIVDRFQGQEQDIVLLSLTRSNSHGSIGFLKNLQRVNVSLSRAKQNLIIVGNASFFANIKSKPTPVLKHLAQYCRKNGIVRFAEVKK
ncbi:MAG: AAA domain-containing protein [Candidatus Kariarchaeaceae archaeon]